ncbi:MAG: hypothetical protein ACOCYO_04085 [Bacteroidota bacterium]
MENPIQQTNQPLQTGQKPWSEKNCCELVNTSVIISESSKLTIRLLKVKADHLPVTQGLPLTNAPKNSPAIHLSRVYDFLLPPPLSQNTVKYIYFSDQSPPPIQQKNPPGA